MATPSAAGWRSARVGRALHVPARRRRRARRGIRRPGSDRGPAARDREGAPGRGRGVRSDAVVRDRRARSRSADPRRPAGARDPGRRPHRGGAGRPGRSSPAARSRGGPATRADVRLARAPPREARGARRRFRGPGAAVPADRPHPDAPGVPAPARARRAPRDHVAAAARGPPGPASVAPGGAVGEGGADRGPAVAAAHPSPARSAGRGRAAVDLARAQAARAGWPRDRPER